MFSYIIKTGFKNLGARKLFSFASIGTIACSVLVFCIFFVIAANLQGLILKVQSTIGIQVFFDEGMSEQDIKDLATSKFYTDDVKSMTFKSSDEAWSEFKKEYFDNREELAAAFEDDNPLVNSASYEILLNDINKQYDYVNYLQEIPGVRQVNYSNVLIDSLSRLSFGISSFSFVLILLLLVIAVILISNTISLSSQFRKEESEIMKLIGATNFMIRAPFVFEGLLIGFFGSIIPVALVGGLYNYIMKLIMQNTAYFTNIFEPLNLLIILIPMLVVSVVFSCFVCVIVSFITIQRHLNV